MSIIDLRLKMESTKWEWRKCIDFDHLRSYLFPRRRGRAAEKVERWRKLESDLNIIKWYCPPCPVFIRGPENCVQSANAREIYLPIFDFDIERESRKPITKTQTDCMGALAINWSSFLRLFVKPFYWALLYHWIKFCVQWRNKFKPKYCLVLCGSKINKKWR